MISPSNTLRKEKNHKEGVSGQRRFIDTGKDAYGAARRGESQACLRGADVARRTQSIPPRPSRTGHTPCFSLFPQPLGAHGWAPLSWETQMVSIENAVWI